MDAIRPANGLAGVAAIDLHDGGRSEGSDLKRRLQQRLTAILAEQRRERLSARHVRPALVRLAVTGRLVSIRRFGTRPLTAQDLLTNESLAPEMLDFLAACVKARINLIVSGGTGAGKTTLLNALSLFIPDSERVVTIEDTAELQLQQRHVAKMEALPADPEGGGAVALR